MEDKQYSEDMLRTPGSEQSSEDQFDNNESGHEDTRKILRLLRFMPDRNKRKNQ